MGRYILTLFSLLLIAVLLGTGAFGSVFSDPGVPDGEQFVWRGIRDGKPTVISTVTWSIKERGGRPVYEIAASGEIKQGKYIIDKSDLCLLWTSFFEITEEGKSEVTIEVRNDKQYLVWDYKNKRKEKKRDHYPDGYNGVTMAFSLRGFPFGKQKEVKMKMTPGFYPGMPLWAWRMWKASAKLVGQERITVPAGTFDCYKLEVAASGGLIKRVTSRYYFWYMKEPPHCFVKFQDKDAKNVTELMEMKSDGGERQ